MALALPRSTVRPHSLDRIPVLKEVGVQAFFRGVTAARSRISPESGLSVSGVSREICPLAHAYSTGLGTRAGCMQ